MILLMLCVIQAPTLQGSIWFLMWEELFTCVFVRRALGEDENITAKREAEEYPGSQLWGSPVPVLHVT